MPLFCQECRAIEGELDQAWMEIRDRAPEILQVLQGSPWLAPGVRARRRDLQSWLKEITETAVENGVVVPTELLDLNKCNERALRQTAPLRESPAFAQVMGRAMEHQARTGHKVRMPFQR